MPCRDQFSLYHRRSRVFSRKVRMLWVMFILTDISMKIRRSSHPGTRTMSGMLHLDNCRAGVRFRPHPSKSGGRACKNLMHVGASKLPRRVTRALKLVRGLGVQRMYAGRPHLLVRSCRRCTGLDAWFHPDKARAGASGKGFGLEIRHTQQLSGALIRQPCVRAYVILCTD